MLHEISEIEVEEEEETQSDIEKRRQFLLSLEKQYQELSQNMSKTEAAKQMGYTTNRLYKLQHELYCMEIELNASKRNKEFRESMAVAPNKLNKEKQKSTNPNQEEQEKEI